ncbi:hypothetical protein EST38_g3612 [Candolleomyces aberdarensis]|uniref:Xylanolytic transcriptional activator regulatory domain-containing protein n=1 Tax=Candolleomyces aberdarensis TaxID=2316362 RepID=A0A4Q2DRW3_9AGAR|nr:hypothetical protein EST38_g3612 [Candolleomyces aberdarensis]
MRQDRSLLKVLQFKLRGASGHSPGDSVRSQLSHWLISTHESPSFVLADTEKLHTKISVMSDRIRQLEDALAVVDPMVTSKPHPLLSRDLMKIKSSLELHSAVEDQEKEALKKQEDGEDTLYIDAFGTLAFRDDTAATFYGRSAGSESLLTLYLEQAPWFFGAVTRRQLEEELLPAWYREAPRPANPPTPGGLPASAASPSPSISSSGHSDGPSSPISKGNAHDLALLFVIFCFGSLTDMAMPPAPDNTEAEHYYQLTKACLTIEPVLERPPSVSTIQTLSLMAIYEGLSAKENSIECTWALFGMATKLAQSIGLHRDCARWKLSPGEVQKRRALFWELFITDCWQSLATGRLATFSLPFVDCELPFDPDQTISNDGTTQPSFPYWKARFGAECVSAVVQGTLTSRAPKYSIILELDRKVRDMELPQYAQGAPPEGLGLAQTMSHFMPTNYRELTLLYIHRCFFAHALASNPADPIKSQYAPSFLAGYRSACTIINSVKHQFSLFPAQIARFWVLWTHAFSASVSELSLGSEVTVADSECKVAPAALLELKTACDLFEAAASHGGRAVKFLPILKRLQMKAQQVYRDVHSGLPPKIANDIFRPSGEDEKDELLIFSGKTTTVTTKTAGGNPRSTSSSPQNMPASRAASGSPGQVFTDNPSFANVHPSLVNELNMFDGHIRAQIQNAHRAGGDVFGVPMAVDPQIRQPQQQQQQQPPPQALMKTADEPLLQEQQQAQQQFLQQIEYQRREEMARQQMLHQRQQEEAQRQAAQQEELRRQQQQKAEQQQREQYNQQMIQQRQMQQHPASHQMPSPPQHRSSRDSYDSSSHRASYSRPMDTDPGPYSSGPVPGPSHALHRVPSRSMNNIQQAYQQSVPGPYQQQQPAVGRGSAHSGHHRHHHSPSTSSVPPEQQQQQQMLYTMSPEPSQAGPSHYSPSPVYDQSGAGPSGHPPPPPQQQQQQYAPARDEPNYYWSAAPSASAYGNGMASAHASSSSSSSYVQQQQQQQGGGANGHGQQQVPHPQQQQHPAAYHYTPEGALRGIAAEDPRLQETWQTYMSNVGTPRHFLGD